MDKTVSNKIRCIVRLRQMLRRWRRRAAAVSRPTAAPDVPSGHVAVCVGSASRRFVVRAVLLNHPAFRKLLVQAEEEYGFSRPGPLSLPCEESLFEHLLRHVNSMSNSTLPSAASASLLSDLDTSLCCCHAQHADKMPLLNAFTEKSVW